MAASVILYTPGSGGKAMAESITIGANTGDLPYVLLFDPRTACYYLDAVNISIATANDHIVQLMAGSTLPVKVRQITVEQNANATTAARSTFQLIRLTSAGTGGTSITPAKADNGDSAAGATGMSLPSAKGTETTVIRNTVLISRQAIATTGTQPEEAVFWAQHLLMKPIVIPSGTANGLAIKNINATAAATVNVTIEFTETSYT